MTMKFNGRIAREEWINQARLLAAGNESEFARLYGTGGEGSKESGLRTVRGPRESGESMAVSSSTEDGGSSGGGKMQRPKGISAARGGKADNLQRISGIGPKNEKILQGLGFFHFDQIAAWTTKEIDWVEDHLRFGGRISREEWTKQARLLADGKEAEFTKLYGTGGLSNKKGETLSGSRTRKT
jgi:predicted flap endonuclease-1-like 5' DNA nuclease